LIGAAAAALEVGPDGVVDYVPVVDEVELHAANITVIAASAPTAAAIRGGSTWSWQVLRKPNENGNRFRLTIEH
jgi:hypothetical protein